MDTYCHPCQGFGLDKRDTPALMSFEVDLVDEDELADHCRELFEQERYERAERDDQEALEDSQKTYQRTEWVEVGVPEIPTIGYPYLEINLRLMDLVSHKCGSCKYFRNAAFYVHKKPGPHNDLEANTIRIISWRSGKM